MKPDELLTILARLHWSVAGLAKAAGYCRQSGHDWASGRVSVPEAVAVWLRKVARLGVPGREG